jgi:hypothetical protein
VYRARFDAAALAPQRLAGAASALLDAPSLVRERRKGEGTVAYDLRPFISALDVRREGDAAVLRMTLRHDPEKGVGRPDEVLAALGEACGEPLVALELVRERLELGEGPAPKPKGRQAAASPSRPRK